VAREARPRKPRQKGAEPNSWGLPAELILDVTLTNLGGKVPNVEPATLDHRASVGGDAHRLRQRLACQSKHRFTSWLKNGTGKILLLAHLTLCEQTALITVVRGLW
jgi:hypothetical protein